MLFYFFSLITAKKKYGIVVDAGSSGSRCHFFSWNTEENPPNVVPLQFANGSTVYMELDDIRLASASTDPRMISTIFDPFIKLGIQTIPSSSYAKTRMFVYATAGMRLLASMDQDRVINQTYIYLTEHSPFKIKPHYVRVIDGVEEGIFGWLSVNHLRGLFKNNKNSEGALDMGGASMQIALEITDRLKDKATNMVTIGHRHIPIFAHSFLGYGAVESIASLTRSLHAVTGNKTIYHPCYPNGYETDAKNVKNVHIIGTGDFQRCSELADTILLQHSVFSTIKLPNLAGTKEWTALSTFFYANNFYGLPENSSLGALKTAAEEFCGTPWSTVESLKKWKINKYSASYCWAGIFQYAVLTTGFGFKDDYPLVRKLDKVGGAELSWAPGAMVYNVADIEIEDMPQFSWFILIFGNVMGFGVVLPLYIFMVHRRRVPHYIAKSSL